MGDSAGPKYMGAALPAGAHNSWFSSAFVPEPPNIYPSSLSLRVRTFC